MKQLILIAAAVVLLGGASCSTGETAKTVQDEKNAAAPTADSANTGNRAAVDANRPEALPYNGLEKVSPNAFNAANDNLRVLPVSQPNNLPIGTRPAPDDSTFSATMNKQGNPVETRVFNSHPLLAKVERTIIGRDSKYRVFLKNGKILEAPAEKMNNFSALAPENILDAIGLEPAAEAVREAKNGAESKVKPQ
jgi:hypothetical protein